jgi:uncharacterized protein YuzE
MRADALYENTMTIKYTDLIALIRANRDSVAWDYDVPPEQILYISFEGSGERIAAETLTYDAVDETVIAMDVDKAGAVLGIEIM